MRDAGAPGIDDASKRISFENRPEFSVLAYTDTKSGAVRKIVPTRKFPRHVFHLYGQVYKFSPSYSAIAVEGEVVRGQAGAIPSERSGLVKRHNNLEPVLKVSSSPEIE